MLGRALALAVALVVVGCAEDSVAPDLGGHASCGNGVREPGESCDVASPGCLNCTVAAQWTCDETTCNVICGDGVVGTGADCTNPRRDTECDMTGYWIEREADWARDALVGSAQAQSDWHLYRFEQQGDTFTVKEELDCGLLITGSANVEFSDATLGGLIYLNRMDGELGPGDGGVARPARRGTSKPSAGGCAITFERHYLQRGLDDGWLPGDFGAGLAFSELPALPNVADPVGGSDWPAGATDPDGDGIPGAAFQISSVVSGTRNAVQRQWREYATVVGQPVPAYALEIRVPGLHDQEENVLRVTNCGTACDLLKVASLPARDIQGYVVMSFLGRTLGSPSVSAIVTRAPRQDLASDLATCAQVRKSLPPDSAVPGNG